MIMEKMYSRQELDEIMFEYIKQTAKEMKIELSNKKNNNNSTLYV